MDIREEIEKILESHLLGDYYHGFMKTTVDDLEVLFDKYKEKKD